MPAVAKVASSTVTSEKTFPFTLGQDASWATFAFKNATTTFGQSVYVVSSIPHLGSWPPARAVKLSPSGYLKWTGVVEGLPPSTTIEWKSIKRQEAGFPTLPTRGSQTATTFSSLRCTVQRG